MPPATSTTVPRTLPAHDPISAAAAREKLQALIRSTRMDDLPNAPRRFNLPVERFAAAMQPGRWLELISRSGRVYYANVLSPVPGEFGNLVWSHSEDAEYYPYRPTRLSALSAGC